MIWSPDMWYGTLGGGGGGSRDLSYLLFCKRWLRSIVEVKQVLTTKQEKLLLKEYNPLNYAAVIFGENKGR